MTTLAQAVPALARELAARWPDLAVEWVETIDSTNSELQRRLRAGNARPTLLVAQRQSAARGRTGRQWHSLSADDEGRLTFSLALPLPARDWSGLSLAVGLAVVESLHPALGLKWPNDVWYQDHKLAGILIEASSMGAQRHGVIGIGINLRLDPALVGAQTLRTPVTALEVLWPGCTAGAVLQRLAPALLAALAAFGEHGFAPLQARYAARDVLRGRWVVCSDGVEGEGLGVDASGALCLRTAPGDVVRVHSAEVSVRPQALAGAL